MTVNVRKHPTPEGALRLPPSSPTVATVWGHNAPSTTRCIKTFLPCSARAASPARKLPAPEGLLTRLTVHPHLLYELSGQAARRRKRS